MGETIMLTLSVSAIGRRSISIDILGHCNGETRFRAKQVLVTTSLESGRSIEHSHRHRATHSRCLLPSPNSAKAQRS